MGSGTVRLGIIGTGGILARFLPGVEGSVSVDAVAVASRDAERARRLAAERGIARAHGSYDALLADPGIDAVYICLPNSMHHEWTIRSLAAGKHVGFRISAGCWRRPHRCSGRG